jgi:hypothetical protein
MDKQESAAKYFPTVGDGTGLAHTDSLYKEELQLALRNRGMPLEGLRYPITPSGLHYLLIHYDVPEVNADEWRLKVGGHVSRPFDLTLEEIRKRPSQTIAVTGVRRKRSRSFCSAAHKPAVAARSDRYGAMDWDAALGNPRRSRYPS